MAFGKLPFCLHLDVAASALRDFGDAWNCDFGDYFQQIFHAFAQISLEESAIFGLPRVCSHHVAHQFGKRGMTVFYVVVGTYTFLKIAQILTERKRGK